MYAVKQREFMAAAIGGLVILAGCGGQEAQPPPAPRIASAYPAPGQAQLPPMDVLFDQWREAAALDDAATDASQLTIMAGLVCEYQEGSDLFLGLIADPAEAPRTRVRAAMSMTQFVFPEDTARLIEMTAAERDSTTRACAAHLLSSIPEPGPGGLDRLRELMGDESQQVRVAAVLALAGRGDAEAQGLLLPLWNEDLNPSQRLSLLMRLPAAAPEKYRELFLDAAKRSELPADFRLGIIEKLSEMGGEEIERTLEAIGASDPDAEVRLMAEGAAAAMKVRQPGPQGDGAN